MYISCCYCLPTPLTLASGMSAIFPPVVHQPAFLSMWPAVPSLRRVMSIHLGVTMWCVCGCSGRDDVCCVCISYKGGIVVMDVSWRRLCVSMILQRVIYLFRVGQGICKCVVEVHTVFCYCLLCCGYMSKYNTCVYIAQVCFYVRCSDCVGVCENVGCVAGVVNDRFALLWNDDVCSVFV